MKREPLLPQILWDQIPPAVQAALWVVTDGYERYIAALEAQVAALQQEVQELRAQLGQKGLTLVPLRLYLKRGRAKVELGLAKGKKLYDKRDSLAAREARRDVERALRGRD